MSAGRLLLGLAIIVATIALAPTTAGGVDPGEPRELTIGVVPQRPYADQDTRGMAAAGIESVRVWFSWAQIEPNRGFFNWNVVDATVAANAKAGLTTMPFLFGTPAWAARLDGWTCDFDSCISLAPRSDMSRQAFADFAAAVVRRYGPGGAFWREHRELSAEPIETWQIWNEPNLSSFYGPAVDPVAYGALVKAAADAIRAVDPDAQILLGGLTGTKSNERRTSSASFLNALYTVPEIADSFDGIAVHPYNRKVRGTLDQVETARTIADLHGDDAGLWVTELGWASAGKRRWGLVKSPSGQARLLGFALKRLERNAERWDVRAAYWFAWRDTDAGAAVCGWCPWSGLLDRVGREKPAYDALREFTSERD
jgi:Beta-galactosidase